MKLPLPLRQSNTRARETCFPVQPDFVRYYVRVRRSIWILCPARFCTASHRPHCQGVRLFSSDCSKRQQISKGTSSGSSAMSLTCFLFWPQKFDLLLTTRRHPNTILLRYFLSHNFKRDQLVSGLETNKMSRTPVSAATSFAEQTSALERDPSKQWTRCCHES